MTRDAPHAHTTADRAGRFDRADGDAARATGSDGAGGSAGPDTLPVDPLWPRAGGWPALPAEAAPPDTAQPADAATTDPAPRSGAGPQNDPALRSEAAGPSDAAGPTDAAPRTDAASRDDGALLDAIVVGVPTHRTSLSATRADTTPAAVRRAIARYSEHFLPSPRADEYATQSGRVLSEQLRIADAGDVADPDGDEAGAIAHLTALAARCRLLIALGGDNALTYPVATAALAARRDTAGLITLDAHHDLRDGVSNGSPVRRLIADGFAGERTVQVGIQDFANSRAYRERANRLGITVVSRDEVAERSLAEIAARAVEVAGRAGGPIHVDIDVDVCDRAVAPACPASLPGGLGAYQLRRLVRLLARSPRVVSIDFAEVDAAADAPDGRTVRLVALCVLEALAGLATRVGKPRG